MLARRRALFSARHPRWPLLWRRIRAVLAWMVVTAIAVPPVLAAGAEAGGAFLLQRQPGHRGLLGTAVFVGFTRARLPSRAFRVISQVATVRNAAGVDNGEEGDPVWVATGQLIPWPALWPGMRFDG